MRVRTCLAITSAVVLVGTALLSACAPAAAPTAAPAKATAAPAAATSAPAAAAMPAEPTKPAAAAPAAKIKRGGTVKIGAAAEWTPNADPIQNDQSGSGGYEALFSTFAKFIRNPQTKRILSPNQAPAAWSKGYGIS